MKAQKNTYMKFFIASVILKGFIFISLYFSLSNLTDKLTVFSLFLALYIDQYIMEKRLNDDFRKNHFFMFSIPFFLAFLSQTELAYSYYSIPDAFSLYYILIGFGFLVMFYYQTRLIKLFLNDSKLSRGFLIFATYLALVVSVAIILDAIYYISQYFGNSFPSQSELLLLIYSASLLQIVGIVFYINHHMRARRTLRLQIVSKYDIWNAAGFINNTESIRHICARLDQNVTLVVFKIDNYKTLENNLSGVDFTKLMKVFVDSFRLGLRKHDQFAMLDENIFAVLLAFTDLEKGGAACARLGQNVKKDILSENLELPADFTVSFGLTLVPKKEVNIIPAMKRAALALSFARTGSIENYDESRMPLPEPKETA